MVFDHGREDRPHCPNHSDKCHEKGDALGKVGPLVEVSPYLTCWRKFGQALGFSVGAGGDQDEDDAESDDVEGGSIRVELCNPSSGHAANASMDKHDERGQKEDLIVLWHKARIADGSGREDHSSHCVVDRWSAGDLSEPIGPASQPYSLVLALLFLSSCDP